MANRLLTRRSLAGAAALGLTGLAPVDRAIAQLRAPVRLMVLRRPALTPAGNCQSPCIRGQLFDVSDLSTLSDAPLIASALQRKPICDVIERPWKNNEPYKSAIPKGAYTAHVRQDVRPQKAWMVAKPALAWRIEIDGGAPGVLAGDLGERTRIQFHYGQDVRWSVGCFIVGRHRQTFEGAGITGSYCQVADSEGALHALRAVIEAPGRDPSKITVLIADHGELFPGGPKTTSC